MARRPKIWCACASDRSVAAAWNELALGPPGTMATNPRAAREGTRYAVIRGEDSCYPNPSFPNCNLQPSSIKSNTNPNTNPVLSYVDSFRYPGLDEKNLSAVVTWWVASQTPNGHTSWTIPCTGKVDDKGNACNAEGNAVRVVVTYSFPLSIPLMHKSIVQVSSTSQMVINF